MSTTSILNNLIETLKDGQNGFRAAAEDVEDHDLKTLFNKYSLQRSQFVGELQSLAHSFGDHDPANSGSLAGAVHRGWIDLKAALISKDEHAILAECERGEDVAVAAYRKALDNPDLPSNARSVIEKQFAEVKTTHDHVRNLRDSLVAH